MADTTIVNAASVHSEQGDDEPENDKDEAAAKVGPSADVAVVRTSPARANANGTLTWTLAVANAGHSAATGVTVDDALPAGVELVSAIPTLDGPAGTRPRPRRSPAGLLIELLPSPGRLRHPRRAACAALSDDLSRASQVLPGGAEEGSELVINGRRRHWALIAASLAAVSATSRKSEGCRSDRTAKWRL